MYAFFTLAIRALLLLPISKVPFLIDSFRYAANALNKSPRFWVE
jgi:hypothetical protein